MVHPDQEVPKELIQQVTSELSTKGKYAAKRWIWISSVPVLVALGGWFLRFDLDKPTVKPLGVGLGGWSLFVLIVAVSKLVIHGILSCIVFTVECKHKCKKRVVYYCEGLKNSVENVIWFAQILVAWFVIFKCNLPTTPRNETVIDLILDNILWAFIITILCFLRGVLMKTLGSILLENFFNRIRDNMFNQYVLQKLSRRPFLEVGQAVSEERDGGPQEVNFRVLRNGNYIETKVIDWGKIEQLRGDSTPVWTMKLLCEMMFNSRLSTVTSHNADWFLEHGPELEIIDENVVVTTAAKIFLNIVRDKTDQSYIDRSDLRRFFTEDEVNLIYGLFEVNGNGQTNAGAFTRWLVKLYRERRALQYALKESRNSLKKLSVQSLLVTITPMSIGLWLVVTKITPIKLIFLFFSQLVPVMLVVGNFCKNTFKSIAFIFIQHPFVVGDCCVIDDSEMVVDKIYMLKTTFNKEDEGRVEIPNFILATKNIFNLHRSPNDRDSLEWFIEYVDDQTIGELKTRIKEYLERTPHYWHPEHKVTIEDIEEKRIKMKLNFSHRMKFQGFKERKERVAELGSQLCRIFQELNIKHQIYLEKSRSKK